MSGKYAVDERPKADYWKQEFAEDYGERPDWEEVASFATKAEANAARAGYEQQAKNQGYEYRVRKISA